MEVTKGSLNVKLSAGPTGAVIGHVDSVLLCQECVLSGTGESTKLIIPKMCLGDLTPAPPTN